MTNEAKRLVVVGAGYAGTAIARLGRQRGAVVHATTRDAERAVELYGLGFCAHEYDATAAAPPPLDLRGRAGAVLTFAPSAVPDADLGRCIEWLATAGVERIVYLSSTSVYAPADGAWVDDDGMVAPPAAMGEARVAAEQTARAAGEGAGLRVDVLRLPGIYGPGRTGRERFEGGTYRVPEDGQRWSNRIYVSDIATATLAVLDDDSERRVWLAVDEEPFQLRRYADWVAEALALPRVPGTPWSEIPERSRPFYLGDRRLRATALRERGWRPGLPSFRDGLVLAWAQEGRPVPSERIHAANRRAGPPDA